MLPIYIICHAECQPSAYLCHYFDQKNIAYKKLNATLQQVSELDLNTLSGLVIMGGPYSVNESLPWLEDEICFIQKAIEKNIPIMGVCFGAQLISKALNAEVAVAENTEIGWHNVTVDTSQLIDLPTLNLEKNIEVFEWHEDLYLMPDGVTPIFTGYNKENQGYLYGNILAMQFHLEMTEHMVHEWVDRYSDCLPETSLYVQCPEQILENLQEKLDNLHRQADIIYGWWLKFVTLDK